MCHYKLIRVRRMISNNILNLIFFSIGSVLLIRISPDCIRRYILFGLNFLFYFLLDPNCILLIVVSTIGSYYIGKKLPCSRHSKAWFITGVILSAGVLVFFKYHNFLFGNRSDTLKIM